MSDYKKPDHWQQKARKEGYPARSVYKLQEIDEKFGLLKKLNLRFACAQTGSSPVFRVLDLGAAPGSWSLYVLRKMIAMKTQTRTEDTRIKDAPFLAAADLSPLSGDFNKEPKIQGLIDSGNFFFIQGDITAAETRETLFAKGPYSAIISDAAPSTTGNRMVDTARSNELSEAVLDYAENALAAGGMLAVKVFQGEDSAALLKKMKTLFETAKTFKPQACRDNSMETYFIGLRRKPAV